MVLGADQRLGSSLRKQAETTAWPGTWALAVQVEVLLRGQQCKSSPQNDLSALMEMHGMWACVLDSEDGEVRR